jgi:hypothetical protein
MRLPITVRGVPVSFIVTNEMVLCDGVTAALWEVRTARVGFR